jgi:hypothetical protein
MLGADDKPADAPPKSPSAVAAMREYDKSIDAAEKACREAKLAAEKKLIEKLKPALIIATKAGNLAEANSIEKAMKDSSSRAEELRSPSDTQKVFKIEAARDWQRTVKVQEGQEISIRAAGKWCGNSNDRRNATVGPEGRPDGFYALEGSIGGGPVFKIGSSFTITAKATGTLEMRMHDNDREDNDGALEVRVVVGKVTEP